MMREGGASQGSGGPTLPKQSGPICERKFGTVGAPKTLGRVWKFGNNVDTDQIIPAEFLVTADNAELGRHAFEKVRPEFAKQAKEGDIIVAGENFGCGSSREHAPRALLGLGIRAVIAKSFARIYYRNSINLGLLPIECGVEAEEGDALEIEILGGTIKNTRTQKTFRFKPIPPFIMEIIGDGGIVSHMKRRLKNGGNRGEVQGGKAVRRPSGASGKSGGR